MAGRLRHPDGPDLAERLGTTATAPAPSIESDASWSCLFEAIAGFLERAAGGVADQDDVSLDWSASFLLFYDASVTA